MTDWFEYQIRETWIHSWSRLISLFRDVQSVRCMAISFTYHLRSYMHRLHRGHFQYGAFEKNKIKSNKMGQNFEKKNEIFENKILLINMI